MTDLNLRAELAMRVEDLRIARKHRDEAAARPWTRENERAYRSAQAWVENREAAEQAARGRLIRHLEVERSAS